MTQAQLHAIREKIIELLRSYMSEDDAKERANNLAQVFAWGNKYLNIDDISYFITPTEVKSGISDVLLRTRVAEQICALEV